MFNAAHSSQDAKILNPPPEDDEDTTCCHRARCCHSYLSRMLVTKSVSPCFPQFTLGTLFWLTTVSALLIMSYGTLYIFVGNAVLPGGSVFGLFALVVFSYFLGWSLAYLPYLHIPPVFGMLMAGIIVRNANLYNIYESLGVRVTSKIRMFAVTFLMLRAGLQLTTSAICEHPLFVLNLAIVPCSFEALTIAICCRFILGYPWAWAILTGSIIACISPVVPVNCMVALAEQGYGEDKDIASLLFAAASIDDIHIVSVYSICFSFIFTHDTQPMNWWQYVPGGLRDLILGTILGAVLGIFFIFFPHRKQKYVVQYRLAGLVIGSLLCTTVTSKISLTGAGFLATLIMAYLATSGWRILTVPFNISFMDPFRKAVHVMWHLMQPVLVGVIGADIDFRNWTATRFGLHSICLLLGIGIRILFAFLSTFYAPFNKKERLFVSLSWIAKGTLQAALAPMTYEQALQDEDKAEIALAEDCERIAVIAVVVFAPLGAIIMMLTGPMLLNRATDEEHRRRRELSYIKIMSLQPVGGLRESVTLRR